MDNQEIHDPRFNNLVDKSPQSHILCFLSSKTKGNRLSTSTSIESAPTGRKKRQIIPDYHFKFRTHRVNDSVQYQVDLIETFKVFHKTITETYRFRTQYSKLEKLSLTLDPKGFPPKKFFGNKSDAFIKNRKKKLEEYLNKQATLKSPKFLEFILQIKKAHFFADSQRQFKLP